MGKDLIPLFVGKFSLNLILWELLVLETHDDFSQIKKVKSLDCPLKKEEYILCKLTERSLAIDIRVTNDKFSITKDIYILISYVVLGFGLNAKIRI